MNYALAMFFDPNVWMRFFSDLSGIPQLPEVKVEESEVDKDE